MKKIITKTGSLLLTAVMAVTAVPFVPNRVYAADGIQQQFYVAPGGSDDNDGKTPGKAFATLEGARAAVDKVNDEMTDDIIVNIAAGDYYLEDTVEFGSKDSGMNGHEVIYRASNGAGTVNFIGGERITGWVPAEQTDVNTYDLAPELLGKVYKVKLDPDKYDFNTLYVNDMRATMARTRNRDNNPLFPMAKGEYMRSTGGHNNNLNMNYNPADLDERAIAGMVNAQKRGETELAQVFVWDGGDWDWFTNTIPIASINTAASEWKFPAPPEDYPEKYRTKYNIGGGARYFLQGNLAFMDVEGEYHYNKTTGILYYYPKTEDGAIETQTIIVPTLEKALYFKGDEKSDPAAVPVDEQEVHNITLDGIAVKDTAFPDYFTYSWNWGDGGAGIGYFPDEAAGSTNPSFCESTDRPEFRVGSITLTGTNHITIQNTRVKNSGLYGVVFAGDNRYNVLTNSVVENTGYGGVIFDGGYPAIGKYNNNNTMTNTLIHNVGELVGHAVGFTLMSSGHNQFENLEIFDTPKRAILVLGGFRRSGADSNYDEIKDLYTVDNHFKYVYVHDAQQDAGEDSAVFLSWLFGGNNVNNLHGSNDPNKINKNLEGVDMSIDRYNYFEQMLISDVGADPSVIEKCTSGCLDTAMGASGSQFTNVRATNGQSHLLGIRTLTGGDGYGDVYGTDNTTDNLYSNDCLRDFDDSRMEYDKIGLTDAFPSQYRASKRNYPQPPEDIYFEDDFEASAKLDKKKWNVEKGNLDMSLGFGYLSENPLEGKRSLPINADLNKSGIVVSRTFENPLNKIVEVQYMDLRKDYAGADAVTSVPTTITPNSFIRVDDGETALGLGAVGTVSKDYYQIKKGDELIQTEVKRAFGWHTMKFDYSSGTDVKLYIDDECVAAYDDVPLSFDYIGMGDWEGKGGKAYFDQLYVYGGKYAPPAEDLKPLPPPADTEEILYQENFEEGESDFQRNKGTAEISYVKDPSNDENMVMKVKSGDDLVYLPEGSTWTNYVFECRAYIDNCSINAAQIWDNFAPAWYVGSPDEKGNFNRYTLKYKHVPEEYALYRRSGGDTDMISAKAPALSDFKGKWHDYKIVNNNGTITAYVDEKKVFEYKDTANTSGTIGFDGINVEYFVDDIKVTTQQTQVPKPNFKPGTYNQPITLFFDNLAGDEKVYYTLDGSDPKVNGMEFDGDTGIRIKRSLKVRVVAKKAGMRYSDEASFDYIINYDAEQTDKTALQELYDGAVTLAEKQYTEESWAALERALEHARCVLDDADVTQDVVDQELSNLSDVLQSMETPLPPKASRTLLEEDFEGTPNMEFDHLRAEGNPVRATVSVEEDSDEPGNNVMYVESPDDTIFIKTDKELKDYTLECRIKLLDDWGPTSYDWDNMAVGWYLNKDAKGNYSRYAAKYVRASKELQLYRRTPGQDTTLKTSPAPADFLNSWHDYKISAVKGDIIVSIDGETVFNAKDTTHTQGTVGFDGIDAKYYVDDIKIYTDSTAVTGKPKASVDSSAFIKPFEVTLTGAGNADQIYYTLDGSDPTVNGKWYDVSFPLPLTITDTCTLKVAALSDGAGYSEVAEYTYTKRTDEYIVTFVLDGAETDVTAQTGEQIVIPEDPEKEGYTFLGWYDAKVGGKPVTDFSTTKKVYAHFKVTAPVMYKVTVENGHAEFEEYEVGDVVLIYANDVDEEHVFTGWSGPDGVVFKDAQKEDTSFVMPAGEVTVTANIQLAEPGDSLDKNQLRNLYDSWKDLKKEDYTDATWPAFETALKQAKDALDNASTQAEIDDAAAALQTAYDGLEERQENQARNLLQQVYDNASKIDVDASNAAESAKEYFRKAFKQAKDLLDDPNADNQTMYEAAKTLIDAVHGLGVTAGDKSNLEYLLGLAAQMQEEKEDYVMKYWPELLAAVDAAKIVMDNGDALEEDIIPAEQNLLNAIMKQRYKANKENLRKIMEKANEIDFTKYTRESVATLKAVLSEAEIMLQNEDLSTDDQAQVDVMVAKLQKAIDELKKLSDNNEPGNGGSGGNNGGNNNNGGGSGNKGNGGSVKTGDEAPILEVSILAAGALLGLIVLWKRRRGISR